MNEMLLQMAIAYETIAAGMRKMAGDTQPQPVPTEEKATEKEPAEAPKEEVAAEPEVTIAMLRSLLVGKRQEKKTQEVKALLNQFGYEKLADVPEEKYAEIYKKAQVL